MTIIAEKYPEKCRNLFAVYMDLKKAYDKTDRRVL